MMSPSRLIRLSATGGALACLLLLPTELFAQKKQAELPIATTSKDALGLFFQAREKIDNVEFAAAAPLLDQAIQKDPNFAMAYAYRAFAGGGFNVLRENLQKAVSLADRVSPGEKHWILATQAQADGNTAQFKQHVDELLKLYPSDKRVQALVGNYYSFSAADPKTALDHYTKATAIDKKFAPAFNMIGYMQSRMGNYTAAEDAFKQYISLRPANPNPYDSYAELLRKTGRFDESIAQYQMAVEKDASFVGALAGIGHNQVLKGEYALAREAYQRQFDQAPNVNGKTGAMFWKTVSYIHEGKTDEALKSLEEARAFAEKEKLAPNVINSHLSAAFILGESGRLAKAVKHLELATKSLDEASLPDPVRQALRLNITESRAYVLNAVHEFDAARALADKCQALADSRQNPSEQRSVHALRARIALEEGKYDEALAHFEQADQEDPYNWYYKAVTLEKKGNQAAAADLFSKVAGWNDNSLAYALVRSRSLTRTASR